MNQTLLSWPATAFAAAKTTLIALVAANATDAFNDILATFEHNHPSTDVKPEYAGTQILETQLEEGAPADIFLSADLTHIRKLWDEGLIFDYRLVSKSHEVIVVPKGNPARILSLHDLGSKSVKLVIGTESVPIGAYTRQIFAKAAASYGAGFSSHVMANVVSLETNTKEVLAKVVLGEADAGIVYKTDVSQAVASKVAVIEIPAQFEVESENYIAVAKNTRNLGLAQALMAYAVGADGQAVFRRHGYDALK